MKKIDENFYGYIRVEGDTYTYNVSDNIVTLLPAQSDPQKRDDSLYRIKSHKTDTPEYLFGEDNNSMIAILRNGKFVTDPIGTRGAYNLGKVYTFFRFSFENAQGFEKMEKYYIIARKIVAILTSQNNICFEEVYLSQRNSEQKYFKTGICKIFDSYENYSIRQWHKVIPIFSVFDYIPNLIDGIVNGKVNSLLELLPEDNKMVNRISIKNVQDLCTALEVSYQLDDKRKREKDALIEELKKNIKNTIAEFTKAHNEIDVNKETTMSSAFQYLDYTLKQKILTLYNENSDIVDEIVSKYSLPSVNENSIASFVKLRNNKTHSGMVMKMVNYLWQALELLDKYPLY